MADTGQFKVQLRLHVAETQMKAAAYHYSADKRKHVLKQVWCQEWLDEQQRYQRPDRFRQTLQKGSTFELCSHQC